MNLRLQLVVVGICLATGVFPAVAAEPPVLSDLPKLYPKAYALWRATIPRSLTSTPWLSSLNGVVSPIRTVAVDGQSWRFGTVCVPHDCGSNILGLVFSPQQDRLFAVATLTGNNEARTLMIFGDMPPRMVGCIRHLTDDFQATSCP